jgi:prevent-host-death family protein
MDVSSAEFRKNFFQILGRVQETHEVVVITKRGRPVARLVSMEKGKKKDPLIGALSGLGRTKGDLTEPLVDAADFWLPYSLAPYPSALSLELPRLPASPLSFQR